MPRMWHGYGIVVDAATHGSGDGWSAVRSAAEIGRKPDVWSTTTQVDRNPAHTDIGIRESSSHRADHLVNSPADKGV